MSLDRSAERRPEGWLRGAKSAPNCLFTGMEGLTVIYAGGFKEGLRSRKMRKQDDALPVTLVTNRPIPTSASEFYFEVEILSLGSKQQISIGLCPDGAVADTRRLHGWSPGSVTFSNDGRKGRFISRAKLPAEGLHVYDMLDVKDSVGKWEPATVIGESEQQVFVHYVDWDLRYDEWVDRSSDRIAASRTHTKGEVGQLYYEPFSDSFSEGDVIGCGYLPRERSVYFTKNGINLHEAYRGDLASPMYAAASLHSYGSKIRLNLGGEPFKYRFLGSQLYVNPQEDARVNAGTDILEDLDPQHSDAHGVQVARRQQAADILDMGVLPECSLEQVARALELNGDRIEQTISWAFDNPFDLQQLSSPDAATTSARTSPSWRSADASVSSSSGAPRYDATYAEQTFLDSSYAPDANNSNFMREEEELRTHSDAQQPFVTRVTLPLESLDRMLSHLETREGVPAEVGPCMATRTHTHARPHTHSNTHAHTHAHTHTYTHTHTHTHT
jgi:hypothetical protein